MEIGIARLAGIVWVAYFAVSVSGSGLKILPLSLAANAVYVVVAIVLFRYLSSADPVVALAVIPLAVIGCAIQSVGQIQDDRGIQRVALAFFGLYLAVLGYLLLRADVAPRAIGYALVAGGLASLTFVVPQVRAPITAVAFGLAAVAECAFTLWLLVAG